MNMPARSKISQEEVERLYLEGLSINGIARKLGVNPNAVMKRLKKSKVYTPSRKKRIVKNTKIGKIHTSSQTRSTQKHETPGQLKKATYEDLQHEVKQFIEKNKDKVEEDSLVRYGLKNTTKTSYGGWKSKGGCGGHWNKVLHILAERIGVYLKP